MKATLLIALIAFSLARYAFASGPPAIVISTEDAGIRYRLEPGTIHAKKESKTLEEVETWINELLQAVQVEAVLIYPDERTSFRTVLDVLRRLKAAGVENFMVTTTESTDGAEVFHNLRGKTDKIQSHPRESRPSQK